MFLTPGLYLLALGFACLVYWAVPQRHFGLRAAFLITFSLALVTLYIPALGLAVVLSSLLAYAYTWVQGRLPGKWTAAAFIAIQVGLMLLPDLADLSVVEQAFTLTGIAYFTLRNAGFVIDVYKQKTQSKFSDLIFLNVFFPTYSAGPVENIKTLNTRSCDTGFQAEFILLGAARILVGILKFYVVTQYILDPVAKYFLPNSSAELDYSTPIGVWASLVFGWFSLYISFSGYADIAIGSSRMFGIRVRENFNFPIFATNIQNFWQRWNISIMNFTSEYVYLNFVRVTGLRVGGLFLVFLCIGIWHHFTVNYVIWGLAHATAMTVYLKLDRHERYRAFRSSVQSRRAGRWGLACCGWFLTITFVSLLSGFANAESLKGGLQVLSGLLP
ncbi:MAG: MBOAT family O-acyltransferase [Pseudomonadota bacterium]